MKKSVRVLVALAVVGLGACGGGSDKITDEEAADQLFGDSPKCSQVWKVGETLDLATYEGCETAPDEILAAVSSGCYDADSNMIGMFATFEDRLWVVQEGTDKDGKGGTPGKVTDVDPKC